MGGAAVPDRCNLKNTLSVISMHRNGYGLTLLYPFHFWNVGINAVQAGEMSACTYFFRRNRYETGTDFR